MRLDRKGVPKDNIVGAPLVRWQSGDVADCKSAYAGSIPARTSNYTHNPLIFLANFTATIFGHPTSLRAKKGAAGAEISP